MDCPMHEAPTIVRLGEDQMYVTFTPMDNVAFCVTRRTM